MFLIVFVAGIGIFLYSLVGLIINLVKKNPIGKLGVGVVLGLIIAFTGMMMTPSQEEKPIAEVQKEEAEDEEEQIEDKEPEKSEEENPKEGTVDDEGMLDLTLTLIKNNFEGLAEVDFIEEHNTFTLTPTGEVESAIVALITNPNNQELVEGWQGMVENFKIMSKSIADNTGGGYQLHFLNPINTENTLLILLDGVKMYDFMDE